MILSTILCKKYCKFRTGNVKLPIETGRWLNIPKDNIICKLCDCNKIGDEFHYLFKCTDVYVSNSRVICLPKHFKTNPNGCHIWNTVNCHKEEPSYQYL